MPQITKAQQVGRPTKYDPKYCNELVFYFETEPNYEKELEHYDKEGKVKWIDYKLFANPLPTFQGFARKIGVHFDTLNAWVHKHKEFSDAYKKAKELQKWFLIENGLNGLYNPTFAIFTAKNITDMRDVQEHDIDGKIEIIIHDSLKRIEGEIIEESEIKSLQSPRQPAINP